MTPALEKAVTDVVAYLDDLIKVTPPDGISVLRGAEHGGSRCRQLRAALLAAWDEAKAEERRPVRVEFATLEEAKAALRSDRWCPKDVSDELLTKWARPFVRSDQ